MFRLAKSVVGNDDKKLEKIATECVTESIKNSLKCFFNEGYENASKEELYRYANFQEISNIIPYNLYLEIEDSGIDAKLFLRKKMAQFMNILNDEEEITPDIFIEYLLYRLKNVADIYHTADTRETKNRKAVLRRLLKKHAFDYVEEYKLYGYERIDDDCYLDDEGNQISLDEYNRLSEKYQKEFVRDTIKNLNNLHEMSIDDDSFLFFDWDFSFFDDWGFERTLMEFAHGMAGIMSGYTKEYIKNIFLSVNMELPYYLK